MAYFNEDDFSTHPRTLCDWVKNFRIKKIQMKRKLRTSGSNLRVTAILSTALMTAEHELRRKQQERFNRWVEIQSKIDRNLFGYKGKSDCLATFNDNYTKSDDDKDIAEVESKHREEITNLWQNELKSLDEFMKNMSSCKSSSRINNMNRAPSVEVAN